MAIQSEVVDELIGKMLKDDGFFPRKEALADQLMRYGMEREFINAALSQNAYRKALEIYEKLPGAHEKMMKCLLRSSALQDARDDNMSQRALHVRQHNN